MTYTLDFALALGSGQTGIADLRAQLVNTGGSNVGSAVSTGFVEIGSGNYLWHYAAIPDAHRGGVKFFSNATPATILAFSAINPEEGEFIDEAVSSGGAGATADEVWANPTRTLTQPQVSLIGEPDTNNLECIIATTFEATWSGLNVGATWTAVMFTAKKLLDGADTTALLQVLISNPGAGGDGLQRYMGLAGGAYVANAALTVDQPGGAVTLLVEDDVTALLTKQKVYYDLKLMLADGSSSILADGTLDAVYTPTKTINL